MVAGTGNPPGVMRIIFKFSLNFVIRRLMGKSPCHVGQLLKIGSEGSTQKVKNPHVKPRPLDKGRPPVLQPAAF
jgi:hypothetical protein